MKKILLIAVMFAAMTTANAENRLSISTWNSNKLEKFDRQQKDISMFRYVFTGWNTMCVPFDMTEEQINETFGNDCKVEALVGAEGNDQNVTVYFNDVKSKGIEANKPYLIYYTGESKNLRIMLNNVEIKAEGAKAVCFTTASGTTVSMSGTMDRIDGLTRYGIPAKDNGTVNFVPVSSEHNGIYPTRCSLSVMGGNNAKVNVMHGEPTSINDLQGKVQKTGVVYNLKGQKVNANAKGIVISDGKKHIN